MKKSQMIVSILALVAALAACDRQADAPETAETATAASGGMSEMPLASQTTHGKSTGTVTAIDTAKGIVTLDHGEITQLKWPAMKMDFAIEPDLLEGIKVGDKVAFEIDWDGQAGTVTKIGKTGF